MFDKRLHDYWEPPQTEWSRALVERMCGSWRAESRAAADRLDAIGELFELRCAQRGEQAEWAVDTWAAVGAEVAAAFRISLAMAGSYLRDALAMRERLPQVAALFLAGDIDYRMFQTLVYRTDLITDDQVLATVDRQLAANVVRWPSMTRGRLAAQVDKIVARADIDAVRQRKERQSDREVWIADVGDGLAEFQGRLFSLDAHALDQRLDAFTATVCAHDPRSRDQRRADALGALAAGADRLGCRCGRSDCAAGKRPASSPVVIHVIAEQATINGTDTTPGSGVGADELITPELVQELAGSAKLVALVHPADAPPEKGYVPSKALADFVRCRDLTCRAPGCDRPAFECDIDHTIPYAQGGPTHASNLKCYCRTHHLVKTFWDWREKQLPDGTLIVTTPDGHTYVTTPGSALLFPSLCRSVGGFPTLEADPPPDYCGERTAMMPKRRRTRSQDRAARVATERQHNREATLARKPLSRDYFALAPPSDDEDDPPPF